MLWAVFANESRQSVNRREPLVPCGRAALSFLLNVNEKTAHQFGRQVAHRQCVDGYAFAFCHVREKQDEHIAVLSTYLGHSDLEGTKVYLSMTPELLQQASLRFARYAGGGENV
jgi:hypothetical protein